MNSLRLRKADIKKRF